MKKAPLAILALVLLSSLTAVMAQEEQQKQTFLFGLGPFLEQGFGYVFVDFASKAGTDTFYIWIRVMLGVVLFTALFYAAQKALTRGGVAPRKNITLPIALSISLISVIMIPNSFIEVIAVTYGVIAIALFLGAPVLGLIYLMHRAFPTNAGATRADGTAYTTGQIKLNHVIKGVGYYLIATITKNYQVAIANYPIFQQSLSGWQSMSAMAVSISTVLMIYHFIAALGGGGGAGAAAGETRMPGWLNRALGRQAPQTPEERAERIAPLRQRITEAEGRVHDFEHNVGLLAQRVQNAITAGTISAADANTIHVGERGILTIAGDVDARLLGIVDDVDFAILEQQDILNFVQAERRYRASQTFMLNYIVQINQASANGTLRVM